MGAMKDLWEAHQREREEFELAQELENEELDLFTVGVIEGGLSLGFSPELAEIVEIEGLFTDDELEVLHSIAQNVIGRIAISALEMEDEL